ncbi:MAG TPA: ABC transporter ATP-binding protein [Planctomycetota bacterium]|nr:ABC transporter ATP-binding protein [Planctomycetota bacterium]
MSSITPVAARFAQPLPARSAAALDASAVAGALRFTLASDLRLDHAYGASWVAVTERGVATIEGDVVRVAHAFTTITAARAHELFGGGRVALTVAGAQQPIACFSRALVPEFAILARIIDDCAHGREPLLPEELAGAHCARCAAPLPERGALCALCVPRGRILMRLVGLLAPYRARAIALACITAFTVATQLIPPYLTKLVHDDVTRGGGARVPWLILGMAGCAASYLCARLVAIRLTTYLSGRLVADLRSRLHATMQRLRLSWFGKRDAGEVVQRVMNDTAELQQFLVDGLPYILVNGLSFIAIAAILIAIDPLLAALVFLPVPLLVGGGAWFWRKLVPLYHAIGSRSGAVHATLDESVHGIRAVKAFAQEPRRARAFDQANDRLFGVRLSLERTFGGFNEGMFFVMSLGVAGVWWVGSTRAAAGGSAFGFGDLLAFVGYIWMFYGPLQWFTAVFSWLTNAFAAAERIFAVFDQPIEADHPQAVRLPAIRGDVAFADVRFSYERGKEVLKGVDVSIAAGEFVGLVGRSGSGKSTIIGLLSRFYGVDSGAISVDGVAIERLPLDLLRRSIGVVMQEPFLFNDTVAENIRFGRPDASFAEVVRAAKAACVHDAILDKEEGYDTVIGDSGARLSGGERQRIAIARAILHDPRILILDEATSAVDNETERAIQEAIGNLVRGRTTIAIAHRLSTLRDADRIVVIDDGRVVEEGTHAALIARDGHFASLLRLQEENNRTHDQAA